MDKRIPLSNISMNNQSRRNCGSAILILLKVVVMFSLAPATPIAADPVSKDESIVGQTITDTRHQLTKATINTDSINTELLMIEESGCAYCAKFNREISVAYPKTEEGKAAPLRRLDLYDAWPESLSHIEPPTFTPTFILLHDNKEVGRLLGYNGDEYFWFLLGELLEQIDQPTQQQPTTHSSTTESGS